MQGRLWGLEVVRSKTPQGAMPSFQQVSEPTLVAADRQAVFPDTWSLPKERGQQERARPGPGEQLGGETPMGGSLVRPIQGLKTPRTPEGTTETAAEARREQLELPQAVVMDTPNTTERISTSGQAGGARTAARHGPSPGGRLARGHACLTACDLPLCACLLGQPRCRGPRP